MPQGKLKVKAKMPPKTAAKARVKTTAQRKAVPMKAKHQSFGQKVLQKSEKVLIKKIEQDLRSRSTSDGHTSSTTGVKGSALHSATSSGIAVSKAIAVKQVLRKFK